MAFTHKKFVVRTNVLWVGQPADAAEFTNRGLSVELCDPDSAAPRLSFASALIVNTCESDRGRLAGTLRQLAIPAIDHGLILHVIADSDATQRHVRHVLKSQSLTDHVIASTQQHFYRIAESIARHECGPSVNGGLTLEGESLSASSELLLRRAFCDCDRVVVSKLTGGTSDVLSVHAVFSDSRSGPRPLPFFAKLGERSSIETELQNYKHYVDHFVPFYLRPNLDYDRCISGFESSVLVGNFVEHSESLLDVARRNMAQPAIHSLFDNALRGWRLQGRPTTNNLLDVMPWDVIPDKIPDHVVARANEYGVARSPQELDSLLRELMPVSYLSAPYHGDLHSDNVRVRGNDAILIDFQRIQVGPLLADHACLEISFAFNERPGDTNNGWTAIIDKLFSDDAFVHPPDPPLEPAPREWLWNVIRQIRTIALAHQLSNEYRNIFAISLLRFARLPARATDTSVAEERKAYAYFVANRLISSVVPHA